MSKAASATLILVMANQEFESFVSKFRYLSSAGFKAQLNVSAEEGKTLISLNVELGSMLPTKPQPLFPDYPPPLFNPHSNQPFYASSPYQRNCYYKPQEKQHYENSKPKRTSKFPVAQSSPIKSKHSPVHSSQVNPQVSSTQVKSSDGSSQYADVLANKQNTNVLCNETENAAIENQNQAKIPSQNTVINPKLNSVQKEEVIVSKEHVEPSALSPSSLDVSKERDADVAKLVALYSDWRYEPTCCNHRHIVGRDRDGQGAHNVPQDGSQCCYHRCKNNPHFISRNPKYK